MYLKFHCPTTAVTLFSKDGKGRIHSSSDRESQNNLANSGGTLQFKIIYDPLDAEVRCVPTWLLFISYFSYTECPKKLLCALHQLSIFLSKSRENLVLLQLHLKASDSENGNLLPKTGKNSSIVCQQTVQYLQVKTHDNLSSRLASGYSISCEFSTSCKLKTCRLS